MRDWRKLRDHMIVSIKDGKLYDLIPKEYNEYAYIEESPYGIRYLSNDELPYYKIYRNSSFASFRKIMLILCNDGTWLEPSYCEPLSDDIKQFFNRCYQQGFKIIWVYDYGYYSEKVFEKHSLISLVDCDEPEDNYDADSL